MDFEYPQGRFLWLCMGCFFSLILKSIFSNSLISNFSMVNDKSKDFFRVSFRVLGLSQIVISYIGLGIVRPCSRYFDFRFSLWFLTVVYFDKHMQNASKSKMFSPSVLKGPTNEKPDKMLMHFRLSLYAIFFYVSDCLWVSTYTLCYGKTI